MLISLATMDFRLCYILYEKLTKSGFEVEHIIPGKQASKKSILLVTTEKEAEIINKQDIKMLILSSSEIYSVNRAFAKILLSIEGKKIWETLIIGVDPGITIGVAIVTDGCLRTTLETRDLKESIKFIDTYLKNNPAKMTIIRIGSAGGYRRILLINELLQVKPKEIALEIVDELQTTPPSSQEAKNGIKQGAREGIKMPNGKNATAAMEIAFRIGESINTPENVRVTEGELKEIQNLSRQYSKDNVTISRDLAEKVAMGLLSIEEAIEIKKMARNKE